MITNEQYKLLLKHITNENNVKIVASKSGMSETTARKYLRGNMMPSEMKKPHNWETRENPFKDDWETMKAFLKVNPGLQAKTIFLYLQKEFPGKYKDGQLRTLQRKVKIWRIMEGQNKDVIFEQIHHPGDLSASDFTEMNKLKITINGETFNHKIYHFILTYSNWETGTICFSESYEALSEGLQNALWKLGKAPNRHRTDSLTAAVKNVAEGGATFQERHKELMNHYSINPEKTNPVSPNENGDSEKSHHLFKTAVNQSLMLRGSRNFDTVKEYELFLETIFNQLNSGREAKLQEELTLMQELPKQKVDAATLHNVRVHTNSTITVKKKIYSVPSRMIGETVIAKLYSNHLEVNYAQKTLLKIPRIIGEQKALINYTHIINSLIRKPGAFENYKYKSELFPTINFRVAYDSLEKLGKNGIKQYLKILKLSTDHGEEAVNKILQEVNLQSKELAKEVENMLLEGIETIVYDNFFIDDPDLSVYDSLSKNRRIEA